jgi:hypothetical protein
MTIEEIRIDSIMQTTSKFLVSFLLFLALPLSAIAQDSSFFPPITDRDQAQFRAAFNPVMRVMSDAGEDRSGIFITLLRDFPGLQAEFGITEEQMIQYHTSMRPKMQETWETYAREITIEVEKKLDEDINYVMNEYEEIATEEMFRSLVEHLNETWTETLTEEQMQGLNNMIFAMTGGLQSPFLSEQHMDALDMTDTQKAQFKKINEETQPERDKMFTALGAEINTMVETGKISVKGVLNTMSKLRELGLMLKQRRSEVLTSSQLAKVAEMARLPKSMTLSVFDVLPKWQPGPNSWKPGDPLPEGIVPPAPRRGNFPRTENPSP